MLHQRAPGEHHRWLPAKPFLSPLQYLLVYPATEDNGLNISLGLFGDLGRAEKVELQAESLNLPADISPRTREGTVFFVDIALPPGKGAGGMIEKYGEEKVLLRDAATCPRSS